MSTCDTCNQLVKERHSLENSYKDLAKLLTSVERVYNRKLKISRQYLAKLKQYKNNHVCKDCASKAQETILTKINQE